MRSRISGTLPVLEVNRYIKTLRGTYTDRLRSDVDVVRLFRLGVIAVEFALIVIAIRLINIETASFELVMTVALGGFLIHHFLPAAIRQGFFAALSMGCVLLVFGLPQGMWLLGLGCLLIVLCHLPLAFWMRVVLIVLTTSVMAVERRHLLPWGSPVPESIWPILGSMFMFRLIVYLYDLKHAAAPFGVTRSLSYFFMLPNVCFPLFPVVDYKTFQRSVYNDDALRLYQTGTNWMLRGLVHLAFYKVVYFLAVVEPSNAVNGAGAAQYMVATYLLYLKISGLFHLIVGLLHMYGYGLAETHHMYLFSSSFTDFWRRINIYWKDFIQKIVFNPVYFSTRKFGDTSALVIATLVAFVATWLLHSYQWFWIRGGFPLVWADVVFWLGLGLVVLVNVLLESRRGRRRSLAKEQRTVREDVILALKIAGTFASICVLWTIWSTPELAELSFLWRAILNSGPIDVAVLFGIPLGIGAIGVLMGGRKREVFGAAGRSVETLRGFLRQAAAVSFGAVAFIIVAIWPNLLAPISPNLVMLVEDMNHGLALNMADTKRLQRGYYEDLGDVTRFNSELWTVYSGKPDGWETSSLGRDREDAIRKDFLPSAVEVFKGTMVTINTLGMRDREYSQLPAPNTFRIALVGASHDMGSGVEDDETYENIVEDRLNRELAAQTGLKFEILNLSFGGYSPTQKLAVVEQKAFGFEPDLILYVANSHEINWVFKFDQLQHLLKYDLVSQFPFMEEALERTGISSDPTLGPKEEVDAKLEPYAEDGMRAILQSFHDVSAEENVRPALVLLEIPNDSTSSSDVFDRLSRLGAEADIPVLDLQGAYADVPDRSKLWIAPWDSHTNAEGHKLLANRLYTLLLEKGLVPTTSETVDDTGTSRHDSGLPPEKSSSLK